MGKKYILKRFDGDYLADNYMQDNGYMGLEISSNIKNAKEFSSKLKLLWLARAINSCLNSNCFSVIRVS